MNTLTEDQRDALDALVRRFEKAETAEEHAELCRLEAEILGTPLFEENEYVTDDGQFGMGA